MDIARRRELADSLQDAKEKLAREKSYLEKSKRNWASSRSLGRASRYDKC
jgi:hypothetical protein